MRLLVAFFLTVCCIVGYACEVIDDRGQHLSLPHPAKRIISLAPDITEDLFAIGAGNLIVGVMQGSDYPSAAKKIPVVGSANGVDAEAIYALHPDLIVAWAAGPSVSVLQKLGVPVYVIRSRKLLDVPVTLSKLGCLTGRDEQANRVATQFLNQYHQLSRNYDHQKKVSVFYQIWMDPLITITKESWIDEAITLCGGKNVFADLHGAAPGVTVESVIAANPDVIIFAEQKNDSQLHWNQWTMITAVREKRLVTVNPDLIERASPRLIEGVSELCQRIESARPR